MSFRTTSLMTWSTSLHNYYMRPLSRRLQLIVCVTVERARASQPKSEAVSAQMQLAVSTPGATSAQFQLNSPHASEASAHVSTSKATATATPHGSNCLLLCQAL